MFTSGFADATVSRSLTYSTVAASILASITDTKHSFYIQVDPHIWQYGQVWRFLVYQLCYTNSTEVLFAAMALYNMRVIERLWGSRKYASFLLLCFVSTTVVPPALLILILRPLSLNSFNYLPAGPTPLIFAILSQYHAAIPQTYKYRISTTSSPTHNVPDQFSGVTLSDKFYVYLPAIQLSLSQFPGSLLGALVGWILGSTWRNGVLPSRLTAWRVPGWMLGIRAEKRSDDFEGLRRRLEGEGASTGRAQATGSDGRPGGEIGRRRTLGRQLLDQFRGAF